MKRFFALLLILTLCLGGAHAEEAAAPAAVITATGVNRVELNADRAVLTLYPSGTGETVAEAQAAADAMCSALTAALMAAGVAETDIRATRSDVEAQYDYHYTKLTETQVVTGYCVKMIVDVTIHDVNSVSALVAAAVEAATGASYELTFQSTQTDAAYSQALSAAAQDAIAKAGQLAQSCGLTLGEMVSVTEAAPHYEEGALVVEASVEVAYRVQ